jgi:hypothetical protein
MITLLLGRGGSMIPSLVQFDGRPLKKTGGANLQY